MRDLVKSMPQRERGKGDMELDFDGEVFTVKCRFQDNYKLEALDARWSKSFKHWRVYNSKFNRQELRKIQFKYFSKPAEDVLYAVEEDPLLDTKLIQFTEPRPFQTPAAQKLLSLKYCALFAPVGSGKTKIGVDVLQSLYLSGKINKILVIGLVSIIGNWEDELEKHWVGNKPPMDFIWITGVESYSAGKLAGEVEKWVDNRTAVLIDESSKIKNSKSIRTEKITKIGDKAGYRYIMTGSSVLNGEVDLYSQFNFLHPDIVGITTEVGFKKRYCIYGGYENKKIIGYKRQEELLGNLIPYSFVITKEEAMPHLPSQTFSPRRIPATAEQKRLMAKVVDEMKVETKNNKGEPMDKRIKNALTKILRISQIAGGFNADGERVKGGNPKVDALADILDDSPDEQMVVFTRYVPELIYLGEVIKDSKVIYGGVDREERHKRVKSFQNGDYRVIISQYRVGALGLNMDSARLCSHFSFSFDLEEWIQSVGRIARTTQTRPMTYFPLLLQGSADSMMYRALQNKENISKAIERALMTGNMDELI